MLLFLLCVFFLCTSCYELPPALTFFALMFCGYFQLSNRVLIQLFHSLCFFSFLISVPRFRRTTATCPISPCCQFCFCLCRNGCPPTRPPLTFVSSLCFRLRWWMRSVAPCTRGWRAQSPVAPSTTSWPILSSCPCPRRRRLASPPLRRLETKSTPSPAPHHWSGEEKTCPPPSPSTSINPSEFLLSPLHQHHLSPHQPNCHTEEGSHDSFCTHTCFTSSPPPPSVIPATLCFSYWLWRRSACKSDRVSTVEGLF